MKESAVIMESPPFSPISTSPATSESTIAAKPREANRSIVLAIVVVGTLMGALDSTIVLLAFPTITDRLHSDFLTSIWIILAYLLILAVTTTQLGRMGDIYGRSRMFNVGFAVFTIGSVFCGFSPNVLFLIVSRVVQAVGGSLVQSNSSAIIADVFPREVRGRAFGYTALGFTAGAMLGIVLGGVITTFLGWQYIFFINAPIGVIAVYLGLKYLKDAGRIPARIDLKGMVILGLALSLFSLGVVGFAAEGLTTTYAALIVIGAVLIPVFIAYDHRLKSPMIDFPSLKNIVVRNSIAAMFFTSLGYLSVVFLIILYLQGIRALSPLNASLLLIPGYVAGSFLGPVMGRLSDKYGSRNLTTLGAIFLIGATLVYLTLKVDSSYYVVLLGSAISGIGTSMFFPANFAAVMANARSEAYGSISGLLRTVQNIGLLGSYVLAITVASVTVPRSVAFEVFIGTTNLQGGVSRQFLAGIDSAFYTSIIILIIAGILSYSRGKEPWRHKTSSTDAPQQG